MLGCGRTNAAHSKRTPFPPRPIMPARHLRRFSREVAELEGDRALDAPLGRGDALRVGEVQGVEVRACVHTRAERHGDLAGEIGRVDGEGPSIAELSIYLSIYPSIHLFIYLSINIYLSIYLSTWPVRTRACTKGVRVC